MTFVSSYRGVNVSFKYCFNSVLSVCVVVAAFNQEKALVGAFSVIVQLHRLIMNSTTQELDLQPVAADHRPWTAGHRAWAGIPHWRHDGCCAG